MNSEEYERNSMKLNIIWAEIPVKRSQGTGPTTDHTKGKYIVFIYLFCFIIYNQHSNGSSMSHTVIM